MEYLANLKKLKGKSVSAETTEPINVERLKTLYESSENVELVLVFKDKRKLSIKQRKFYYALLGDIYDYSGNDVESLDDYFKNKYLVKFGKKFSWADLSENSMSDATEMLDMLVEFIFEWSIPINEAYPLLPKNEGWYLYHCCKFRKCSICGRKADIHHEDNLVGIGRDRRKHDHTQSTFIALCRNHHTERHTMTWQEFKQRYHVEAITLSEQTIKLLKI